MNNTSENTRPVLVIGSTGKTGRRVAEALDAQSVPVRRTSRSSAIPFDWANEATWGPALDGAGAAYVVPSEGILDETGAARFATLAADHGLDRITLLSVRRPGNTVDGDHALFESALGTAPVPTTVLRPAWFAQNFTEGIFVEPLSTGTLALPVGTGSEPFIDVADIGEVAAATLTDPRHDGAVYELSGPASVSFDEAVAAVAAASGNPLRFEAISAADWATSMEPYLPAPVITMLGEFFADISAGRNDFLSTGVRDVLGREPTPFTEAIGRR